MTFPLDSPWTMPFTRSILEAERAALGAASSLTLGLLAEMPLHVLECLNGNQLLVDAIHQHLERMDHPEFLLYYARMESLLREAQARLQDATVQLAPLMQQEDPEASLTAQYERSVLEGYVSRVRLMNVLLHGVSLRRMSEASRG